MRDADTLIVVALATAVAGCGRSELYWPEELPPRTLPTEAVAHDARFIGLWMVDQPYHAGYEATFYAFGADGRLQVVDSFGRPQTPPEEVTGVVAPSQSAALRCVFGESWHSVSDSRLIIDGRCTDGIDRGIELSFTSAPAQNASAPGASVSLISVGGEPGWIHPGFEWRFKRCPPGPASVPAGACEG